MNIYIPLWAVTYVLGLLTATGVWFYIGWRVYRRERG